MIVLIAFPEPAKIFSTVDMTSGYFQVPVKESDIPKTAFITKHGLFEFTSMPQGLTNSSATFQRVMQLALSGLQWNICIIYIDDCIIFSSNFKEHIERLKLVLERFKQANLKLKPAKCSIFQTEVTFLGFRVSVKGVLPDPTNVAKILQWKEPQNVTELKQFLGCCSYYRKFIRGFSKVAKPLFDITKKSSSLVWNNVCQIAFNTLKGSLSGPDVMSLPRDQGTFYVDVYACDSAIGCVLSQIQDGKEKVIAYGSRTLNKSERNYCVTDKELLAIRYFLEYFRHYLLGRNFVVRSDHEALKYLFSLKCPKGRVARWLEILSEYSFSVEFRKGSSHSNADSLSRCPNPKDCDCSIVDMDENLKCGPCLKCRKRAVDMHSDWSLGKFDRMNDVDSLDKGEKNASINRKINTSSREIRQNVLLNCYLFISFCLCTTALLYKEIWLFISQTISDYFMSCQNISQTQFSNSTGYNIKQNYGRPGSSTWMDMAFISASLQPMFKTRQRAPKLC